MIELLKKCGADKYLSGPAAKSYLKESMFKKHNISVEWMDYSGYPEYRQLFPPFEHKVSIIDLLFNEGPRAKRFIKAATA